MSSEKEFDAKSTVYTKSFGYLLNLEERGLAQDAFSTAWDFQQTKLDEKDKEIERLKKENTRLNISLNTCKNDFWFMINLLEKYSSNKEEAINACIERMKFRKPLFETLREVESERA